MQSSPQGDGGLATVLAPTLQDAYRRVKKDFGHDAVIVGSRTVERRQGLGRQRAVEVTVQTDAGAAVAARRSAPAESGEGLAVEVARIESLVASLEEQHARIMSDRPAATANPLARTLSEAGAGDETVAHLLARFSGETGKPENDRPGFLSWLEENLAASNSDWDGFYGCHAFLGRADTGRSDLVLAAAAALSSRGRRTLMLSIMPAHRGEVRRLQTAAAAGQFDAAVIQNTDRIAAVAEHLAEYDAVLLDLPDLDEEPMATGGELHRWLAANEGFHRHLVLPLDGDVRDQADLAPEARSWNCDWLTLTHTHRSRQWGKVLDLQRSFGLSLSLLAASTAAGTPEIASAGAVLDRMLDPGPARNTEAAADFVAATPMTAGV